MALSTISMTAASKRSEELPFRSLKSSSAAKLSLDRRYRAFQRSTFAGLGQREGFRSLAQTSLMTGSITVRVEGSSRTART